MMGVNENHGRFMHIFLISVSDSIYMTSLAFMDQHSSSSPHLPPLTEPKQISSGRGSSTACLKIYETEDRLLLTIPKIEGPTVGRTSK